MFTKLAEARQTQDRAMQRFWQARSRVSELQSRLINLSILAEIDKQYAQAPTPFLPESGDLELVEHFTAPSSEDEATERMQVLPSVQANPDEDKTESEFALPTSKSVDLPITPTAFDHDKTERIARLPSGQLSLTEPGPASAEPEQGGSSVSPLSMTADDTALALKESDDDTTASSFAVPSHTLDSTVLEPEDTGKKDAEDRVTASVLPQLPDSPASPEPGSDGTEDDATGASPVPSAASDETEEASSADFEKRPTEQASPLSLNKEVASEQSHEREQND